RMSRLIDIPDRPEPIPIELLFHLAATAPKPEPKTAPRSSTNGSGFDIESWMSSHGIEAKRETTGKGGGRKWLLAECPFQPDDHGGNPFVEELPSGARIFKCFHGDCSGRGWTDLRELVEPGYRDHGRAQPAEHKPLLETIDALTIFKTDYPDPVFVI